MNTVTARALETVAMLMIGDSLLACTAPRAHAKLWLKGPRPWRKLVIPFVKHQGLTTGLGMAGLATGIALARYAERANRKH
jgi:hypothetical protein